METENDFEVISSYTRAQAIDDGVLVDLMQAKTIEAVRDVGIRFNTAMTAAAFSQTVAPIDGGKLPAGQDLQGRLWDVLWMLKNAIRNSGDTDIIHFKVIVAQMNNTRKLIKLKAVCGPGDNAEPVITIMLPDED